jgi:hypothetical protein
MPGLIAVDWKNHLLLPRAAKRYYPSIYLNICFGVLFTFFFFVPSFLVQDLLSRQQLADMQEQLQGARVERDRANAERSSATQHAQVNTYISCALSQSWSFCVLLRIVVVASVGVCVFFNSSILLLFLGVFTVPGGGAASCP